MRCILQPGLPVYCKIGEADYVEHFSGATTVGTYTPVVVPFTGDILSEPFPHEEYLDSSKELKDRHSLHLRRASWHMMAVPSIIFCYTQL